LCSGFLEEALVSDGMSLREQKSAGETGADPNAWMVTFSDLLMLLLTFFVLLLSMGSMDAKCLKMASASFLGGGSGPLNYAERQELQTVLALLKNLMHVDIESTEEQSKISGQDPTSLKYGVEETKYQELIAPLGPGVSFEVRDTDLSIILENNLLFDSGKAELRKQCLPLLHKIAHGIHLTRYNISIEGHTDDTPIKTDRFASNWDLSTARALSMLDYLMNVEELNPARFRVGGYGYSKPLYPNDSDENRRKNRRVEIVILGIRR
jgi:chemotaxis protein MotB